MQEFYRNLKNGQRVRTQKKNLDALIEKVRENVIDGWLVFKRGRLFRASWDLEGNILPNKMGFGSEFSLLIEFD